MEFTILFSTKSLETLFSSILVENLTEHLSDFNKQQLGVLIEKHKSLFCLYITCEVFDYLIDFHQRSDSYSSSLWNIKSSYITDMTSFMSRFLNWNNEQINDLFGLLENALRETVIKTLFNLVGEDIYDNRKFELRGYQNVSLQNTISSERVLSLKYKRKDLSFNGYGVGL